MDHASRAGEEGAANSKGFWKEFPGNLLPVVLLIAGLASLECAFTPDRFVDCIGPVLVALLIPILFLSMVATENREMKKLEAKDVEVQQQLGRVCHLLGEGHSHEGFSIRGTYEGHEVLARLKTASYSPPTMGPTPIYTFDVYEVGLRCPRRGRKWCLFSKPPSMTGEPLEWEIVARPRSFPDRLADAGLIRAIPPNFETRQGICPAIAYLPVEGWLEYKEPPGRIPDVESLRAHLDILVSIRRLDVFSKTSSGVCRLGMRGLGVDHQHAEPVDHMPKMGAKDVSAGGIAT